MRRRGRALLYVWKFNPSDNLMEKVCFSTVTNAESAALSKTGCWVGWGGGGLTPNTKRTGRSYAACVQHADTRPLPFIDVHKEDTIAHMLVFSFLIYTPPKTGYDVSSTYMQKCQEEGHDRSCACGKVQRPPFEYT